jgi:hypothetical protein
MDWWHQQLFTDPDASLLLPGKRKHQIFFLIHPIYLSYRLIIKKINIHHGRRTIHHRFYLDYPHLQQHQ